MVEYVGLFTSLSTLMCCAIPSLLVAIGLGTMLASTIFIFPQLKWFGQNSTILFTFAGLMLLINGFIMYKNRNKPCEIGAKAKACSKSRNVSKYIFVFSIIVYIIALFAKFWQFII